MRNPRIISLAVAVFSLAAVGSSAKDDSLEKSKEVGHSDLNSMQIRRVTQDSLDRKSTAKDLIGSSLFDARGEKIGTIADIGIDGLALGQPNSLLGQDTPSHEIVDHMPQPAGGDKNRQADSRSKGQSTMNSSGHGQMTAYVSVGGLFGIGDDIVAIPANRISWDARSEQFTVSVSKSQIVALAEQEPMDLDNDNYISAKQSFDNDASAIRKAFQSKDHKKDLAGVTVDMEGNRLVLRGTVKNEETKEMAEELASSYSDLRVLNSIKVSSYNN